MGVFKWWFAWRPVRWKNQIIWFHWIKRMKCNCHLVTERKSHWIYL